MDVADRNRSLSRKAGKVPILDRLPFLPRLLAALVRLYHGTCRFTVLGQEHVEAARSGGKPILYTSWHFAFPAVIYHLRDQNGMVMVSLSRDGEWVARILTYLGYESARGSPGKGGSGALKRVISHIRAGYPGGFIADGSQGPALVAQMGIMVLARHTQSPLVPVSVAARPCWRFKSWDRTLLGKPFSRIAIAFGPPIRVDRQTTDEQLEEMRRDLETSLNRLTRQCEEALGTG